VQILTDVVVLICPTPTSVCVHVVDFGPRLQEEEMVSAKWWTLDSQVVEHATLHSASALDIQSTVLTVTLFFLLLYIFSFFPALFIVDNHYTARTIIDCCELSFLLTFRMFVILPLQGTRTRLTGSFFFLFFFSSCWFRMNWQARERCCGGRQYDLRQPIFLCWSSWFAGTGLARWRH